MTNTTARIQMATMKPAATQFVGISWRKVFCASCLHSVHTVLGIILSASVMPSGTRIRSSRYPKTGMKSGIRSIGLKRYPTTPAANTFAYQGTWGCRQARYRAQVSVLSCRALAYHCLITPASFMRIAAFKIRAR